MTAALLVPTGGTVPTDGGSIPFSGTAGAPTAGSFVAGQERQDSTGRVWVCTADGTPGTWQLASTSGGGGAAINTTAGNIQPLGTQAAGAVGTAADAGHVHPTTGVLLAANNLSDVTAATARTNLGLGTAATQASTAFQATGAAIPESQVTNLVTDLASKAPAAWNVRTVTAVATAALEDYILADTTGGTFAVTAPTATTGRRWGIKWHAGSAAPTVTGTFNGSLAFSVVGQAMEFIGDGTTWHRTIRPALAQLPDYPTITDARYDAAGAAATAQGLAALKANNLSDLASAVTARTNLGLGTAATVDTGTTSGKVPLLGTGGVVPIAQLATGTPTGSKFIRDDGTLAVPAGGGGGVTRPQPHLPTSAVAATFDRVNISMAGQIIISGTIHFQMMDLLAGDVVTSLRWRAASATGSGITHSWSGIMNLSGVVAAVSADDTTATWTTQTDRTFTMGSAYTVPTTGTYLVFLCVAATTVPTIWGLNLSANSVNIPPAPSGTAGTAQTTPPAVAATLTLTAGPLYLFGWAL